MANECIENYFFLEFPHPPHSSAFIEIQSYLIIVISTIKELQRIRTIAQESCTSGILPRVPNRKIPFRELETKLKFPSSFHPHSLSSSFYSFSLKIFQFSLIRGCYVIRKKWHTPKNQVRIPQES